MMTSLTEGLPISAVEAQANGLICLLSDRIPADVDITSDVYHLSMDQGAEPWAEMISNMQLKSAEERAQGEKNVAEAGFDNSSSLRTIVKLYELETGVILS